MNQRKEFFLDHFKLVSKYKTLFDNESRKDWKKQLPMPIYDERPEYVLFYMKAWELAFAHIKEIPGMPQTPYMDEAFCDTQIWIWDTCFMSLFCKYASAIFPGVESFRNFYEVLYADRRLPMVIPTDKEPKWTGSVAGEPYELKVHMADNPPLFAWAELENAKIRGDIEYLQQLLYKEQFLQKHYDWIENLKTQTTLEGVFKHTCLICEADGYKWEGGCSGMDNAPRGRCGKHAKNQRPNNPRMLWLDAICQQALSAKTISEMFSIVGDVRETQFWEKRFLEKKDIINRLYWDEQDDFYYDIDCETHDFYKIKTMASYWTLTSTVASHERALALVKELENPQTFGGVVSFPSLARNDNDFCDNGEYWRGSVWLPTAYAALKGLVNYSFYEEAHRLSRSLLEHMYQTYQTVEPHTIWECYSPTEPKPAFTEDGDGKYVRPDFCGWSALGPISIFIEFVLGFHTIDAFSNKVVWQKPKTDKRIGIQNLNFGNIKTDIEAIGDRLSVTSNAPYTLEINGRIYNITAGTHNFECQL